MLHLLHLLLKLCQILKNLNVYMAIRTFFWKHYKFDTCLPLYLLHHAAFGIDRTIVTCLNRRSEASVTHGWTYGYNPIVEILRLK